MRALLSIAILFLLTAQSIKNNQEAETLKATFVEYADDTYYFTDKDAFSQEYQQIKKSVLNTYNLRDDSQKGKSFIITYETDTEVDDEGDDILISIITGLELQE